MIANHDDANTRKAVEGIDPEKRIWFGTGYRLEGSARNCRMEDGSYGAYDLYHRDAFFAAIRLGVPVPITF